LELKNLQHKLPHYLGAALSNNSSYTEDTMQTFLPYADFEQSARILDYRRLGKQRVEAWQILQAINDPLYGWQHHPAVNMWRGYQAALVAYYAAICREWIRRGYQHTLPILIPESSYAKPPWLGYEDFHYSHRSKLFYKSPQDYYGWSGIEKVNYVWPI